MRFYEQRKSTEKVHYSLQKVIMSVVKVFGCKYVVSGIRICCYWQKKRPGTDFEK